MQLMVHIESEDDPLRSLQAAVKLRVHPLNKGQFVSNLTGK